MLIFYQENKAKPFSIKATASEGLLILKMATKRKLANIAKPVQHTTKRPNSTRIDESKTAVSVPDQPQSSSAKQIEPIEISSDSESDYDDLSDLDGGETLQPGNEQEAEPTANGTDADTKMRDGDNPDESEPDAEPTFGDLLRNETVDVAAALQGPNAQASSNTALTTIPPRQIAAPTATSLGTVLAQALRTEDTDLLESCLQISDNAVIRNTIQRLDSSLAGALLTQLAARLHRRPGRAHVLMSYVQWTLVAHGGALATQPEIQKRLGELNRVLEERSRGLNSLLALKGKLDMLEMQMMMRRGSKGRGAVNDDDEEDSNDEDGVIYVEGQEDEILSNGGTRRKDDEDEEFPVNNGVASDSEEDSDDEDQDEMDVDEFAADSLDEDEVDHDDVETDSAKEEEDEEESEVEAAPPAKIQRKGKSSFAKK